MPGGGKLRRKVKGKGRRGGRFRKGEHVPGAKMWKPGQSGNPAGRPKSVVKLIYERTDNLTELIDLLTRVMRGEDIRGPEERRRRDKRIKIGVSQRLDAVRELLAYGAGRPKTLMELTGRGGKALLGEPGSVQFNLALLSMPELNLLEILARRSRGEAVDETLIQRATQLVVRQVAPPAVEAPRPPAGEGG